VATRRASFASGERNERSLSGFLASGSKPRTKVTHLFAEFDQIAAELRAHAKFVADDLQIAFCQLQKMRLPSLPRNEWLWLFALWCDQDRAQQGIDGAKRIISAAFLSALVPQSAGADLMQRGIELNFAGAAQISCPGISIPAADFVGEGSPIPAAQGVTSAGPTLLPHKIAVITSLTGEMVRSTVAEDLVKQVLIESTGPAVDKAMFSATAGDAIRPAGILNGIAPITPTAAGGGTNKNQVLVDDIQLLAAAVAPVAGNGGIVLVASPDAAVALVLRLPSSVEWPVLTSGSLAARTVIAVAANAIVSAVEGVPLIDTSTQASFHRETAPGAIVDVGGVAARPVGSLWQVDEVGLKLTWNISWAVRDPRGVAWMQGVNW